MGQDAAFARGDILPRQRVDQARTNPVRATFNSGQAVVARVVKLGAQFGHAVHVDALLTAHAKGGAELVVKRRHGHFARLAFEATGVEQAAALGQAKCCASLLQSVHQMHKAVAGAQQCKWLTRVLSLLQCVAQGLGAQAVGVQEISAVGCAKVFDRQRQVVCQRRIGHHVLAWKQDAHAQLDIALHEVT